MRGIEFKMEGMKVREGVGMVLMGDKMGNVRGGSGC